MRNLSDEWLAGILEGEGWVNIQSRPDKTYVQVTIGLAMVDADVVNAACAVAGCGRVNPRPSRTSSGKEVYQWTIAAKPQVYDLLLRLRPYLFSRRREKVDQALEVLREDKRIQETMY